ncbi:MAG: YbaK/EbsC family protein [Candidatus Dormibacteria bacterium]
MSAEDTSPSPELGRSAQRVAEELRRRGAEVEVVELPASTRTAVEAASAIGCEVAQIAKSLVFRTAETSRPVLVIASGANRVEVAILAAQLGEQVVRADPDWVRETTGFAIGGIPPVAHRTAPVTYIDEDLLQLEEIWAAAGTPNSVFRMRGADLPRLTGGTILRLRGGSA